MSLAINLDDVVAVYALGEWHEVQKGTCFTDAYEVKESFDDEDEHVNIYLMGQLYPDVPHKPVPHTPGDHWHFLSPNGCCGIAWRDKNGLQVSMSIQEIKGWKTQD